ncbi:LysR family transcriptional regulator [Micromonospora sp. NPDC047707]|uniref:LysR family transcriptional regulator n=1 Tax=Micromonospora sp. NPDC047707 TaxID=3154498 RepID=UPI0034537583
MLNVSALRMLHAVASSGSIAGAAAALGYTPSAVSQQLASLERAIQVRVLERGPRSVRLSDAGVRLAAHAEAVLAKLAEAEADMRAFAGLQTGTATLALFPSAMRALAATILLNAAKALPGITMHIEEFEPAVALSALQDGAVDCALVYDFADKQLEPPRSIQLKVIGSDPFRLCVSANDSLVKTAPVAEHLLTTRPWIADGPPPAESCFALRLLSQRGHEVTVAARSEDAAAVHALVAAGIGVALLPSMAIDTRNHNIAALPLSDPPPPRRIIFAYRKPSAEYAILAMVGPIIRNAARQRLSADSCG